MAFPRHWMHFCRKHEHKKGVSHIWRTLDLLCTRRIKDYHKREIPKERWWSNLTTKFKKFRNKKFDSRKKPNQEKDMSTIQCFNYWKYESLSWVKEKEGNTWSNSCQIKGTFKESQTRWSKFLLLIKVTIFFCNIVLVHTMFTSSCISIS